MPGVRLPSTLRSSDADVFHVSRHDCDVPARRLPCYDYSSAGAYFVTVCTYRRALLFVSPNATSAVQSCWDEIPSHFPVDLDAFVVMPNHVHGIVLLLGAGHARPLPIVIGSFKSAAARLVNRLRATPGKPVWQRGYHERIIRDERELEALREYVLDNPASWDVDPENLCRAARPASAPWL
jgi:putative transposase